MGVLDKPMRQVAQLLTNTFVSETRSFERRATAYDPIVGQEGMHVIASAEIKTPPPSKMTQRETEIPVVVGDVKIEVPALSIEQAEFSLEAEQGVTVFVKVGSHWYRMVDFDSFWSGDQIAMYRLHLRR